MHIDLHDVSTRPFLFLSPQPSVSTQVVLVETETSTATSGTDFGTDDDIDFFTQAPSEHL